jgi:hypothetical protein
MLLDAIYTQEAGLTSELMCEKSKEAKYRDMINSKTVLESRLHDHLTER